MKKILGGILGMFAVVAIVGGSAFALFSAQATVSGITLNTGTAELKVGPGSGTPTQSSVDLNVSDTLNPGENPPPQPFTLLNSSNESDFNLTTKLTSAAGDWGLLSPLIIATVWYDPNDNNIIDPGEDSVSGPLVNWNAGEITLPGGVLMHGQQRTYKVMYKLDASASNDVAGKTLSNITFVFTGTQTNP